MELSLAGLFGRFGSDDEGIELEFQYLGLWVIVREVQFLVETAGVKGVQLYYPEIFALEQ